MIYKYFYRKPKFQNNSSILEKKLNKCRMNHNLEFSQ